MGYQLKTSDDLLVDFKRDSYIASSQGNYDDPQLLAVADKMILQHVVPLLKSLDSGWYLDYTDIPLTTTANTYALPRYAMYGMLYSVRLVRISDGVETTDLALYTDSDAMLYRSGTAGTPGGYELKHNRIWLDRTPGTSDVATYSLRAYHYRRPGRLVLTTAAAVVSTVNTVSGLVTYTAAPPATFTAATLHDFYAGQSPFVRLASNIAATAAVGLTQTFAAASAALMSAGSYVTLEDETVFPDLPIDLYPHLSDLMALQLARSKTDAAQLQIEQGKVVESMRTALASAPGDRIKGRKRKMSLLNSGLVTAGRRRFMVND